MMKKRMMLKRRRRRMIYTKHLEREILRRILVLLVIMDA